MIKQSYENNNNNIEINRVDIYPVRKHSVNNINSAYNNAPPEPLTSKELYFYQKSRENSIKRVNSKLGDKNNKYNKNNSKIKSEDKILNLNNDKNDTNYNVLTKEKAVKPLNEMEYARERDKHIQKQRYYESRYADKKDNESIDDISQKSDSRPSDKRKVNKLLTFIQWLIVLVLFTLLGYIGSYLLFGIL